MEILVKKDINNIYYLFEVLKEQERVYSRSDAEIDFRALFVGLRVENLYVEVRAPNPPERPTDEIISFVHLYNPLSETEFFYPNIMLSPVLRRIARVFQITPVLKGENLYWYVTAKVSPQKDYPFAVEFLTVLISTTEFVELINRDWDLRYLVSLAKTDDPLGDTRISYVGFPIVQKDNAALKLIRSRYGSFKRFYSAFHLASFIGDKKYMFDIDVALFNPDKVPVPLAFIEYKHGREQKFLTLNEKIGYEILSSKGINCYLIRGTESFSIYKLSGNLRRVFDYSQLEEIDRKNKEEIVRTVLQLTNSQGVSDKVPV